MHTRFLGTLLVAVAALALAPALSAQRGQQRSGAPREVKPTPRMPDGKADLRGVYAHRGAVRFFSERTEEMERNRQEAAVTTAEAAMRPEAMEKYRVQLQAGKVRSIERDVYDPTIKACAPAGPSRTIARGSAFEIMQFPNRVVLRYEYDHWVRDVWMDGRGHPKDQPTTWMGHSIGWWEGDTLVVETVGMNDLTTLDSPGTPHSESLRFVERYTRVNSDTLEIGTLFDDPVIFTKPIEGIKMTWRLVPNGEISEWVACDDHIPDILQSDVCEITGAWEYEAYCVRREKGLPVESPRESGPPAPGY